MFTVDQQAVGPFVPSMDFVVGADGFTGPLPCGQEFRPKFAALDVVELDLLNAYSAEVSTTYVSIRHHAIDGPIVGTSALAVVSGVEPEGAPSPKPPPQHPVRFKFSTTVPLVPGDLYVIELVPVSGRIGVLVWGNDVRGGPYPPGRVIVSGQPWEGGAAPHAADLWFREGYVVPDPADVGHTAIEALLILGGVTKGGSGVVITPGGPHPVGPWDMLRAETRDVLKGMALAELAKHLVSDPTLRQRVEAMGLDAARMAIERWKDGFLAPP